MLTFLGQLNIGHFIPQVSLRFLSFCTSGGTGTSVVDFDNVGVEVVGVEVVNIVDIDVVGVAVEASAVSSLTF